MRTLVRGKGEETALWWHSQVLDKQGRMWKYGRAWLRWPGNSIGVCWSLFRERFGMRLAFSDTGDYAIEVGISLPFLFSLWFHIARAKWVKRLPGVKWTGKWGSGDREIYIRFHDGALWWTLWRHDNDHKSGDWRDSNFHFDDFFLGRNQYSESERTTHHVLFPVQGIVYSATVELYTSTWKRSRWPWPKTVNRANVEVETGVPVPGKGENGWDMEDDAIYGLTTEAGTVMEALGAFRQAVIRQRTKYGGENWEPSAE